MCYPPGARPPEVPDDLRLAPMSGGAGGEEANIASADASVACIMTRAAALASIRLVIVLSCWYNK